MILKSTYLFLLQTDRTIAPSFSKSLRDVDSVVNVFCRLECKVSGSLPMKIAWFKNGEEMSPDKHKISFVEGTASLEISRLDMNDAGIYICRATNSAGTKDTKGTLSVKGLVVSLFSSSSSSLSSSLFYCYNSYVWVG